MKLVITLSYYEQMTMQEIADVLGVPESFVYRLHTRAISRLKEALEDAS
jgi:RNA polymerase sigma factor for flagellar operon FliA